MIEITCLILLALIILALIGERYLFGKQMARELSEYRKAMISRNVSEFIAVTTAEKAPPIPPSTQDEIAVGDLSDDAFAKMIADQVS